MTLVLLIQGSLFENQFDMGTNLICLSNCMCLMYFSKSE